MTALADGVARLADLRTELTRAQISSLLAAGRLVRVRRGWYALPHAAPDVVRAVRIGGTLSCVSALAHHRVWVPPDPRLHIRLSEHHHATSRLPDGVRSCGIPLRAAPTRAVDLLPTALLAASWCLADEGFVVAMDSVLNQGMLTPADLATILAGRSRRVRRLLGETDQQAQSGLESMVRFRLRREGVRVRSQVPVTGVGRVDLLVGDRLVIETDGRAHHTGEETYASDRQRDLVLVTSGYLVLRLSYRQVVYEWDAVLARIQRLIRTRAHLQPRRRLHKPGHFAGSRGLSTRTPEIPRFGSAR